MPEHQRDWDDFVQSLTYAYNTQVHRSTENSPYSQVLNRLPRRQSLVRADWKWLHLPKQEATQQYTRGFKIASSPNVTKRVQISQKKQARYKRDYNRQVRKTQAFYTRTYVYLDKQLLLNTSDSQALTLGRNLTIGFNRKRQDNSALWAYSRS